MFILKVVKVLCFDTDLEVLIQGGLGHAQELDLFRIALGPASDRMLEERSFGRDTPSGLISLAGYSVFKELQNAWPAGTWRIARPVSPWKFRVCALEAFQAIYYVSSVLCVNENVKVN